MTVQGEGWQPIEAAEPGQEGLFWAAYSDENGDYGGFVCFGELLSGSGPQSYRDNSGCECSPHDNGAYFTHWMPLPAPPVSA